MIADCIHLNFDISVREAKKTLKENIKMDLTTSKIAAMLLLGGISTLLGFIPMRLGNLFKNVDGTPKHGILFSSLLCFGGGVLLATSMLHMLPEVK